MAFSPIFVYVNLFSEFQYTWIDLYLYPRRFKNYEWFSIVQTLRIQK